MDLTIERYALGKKIFAAVGDSAPPMGMIGTLIGLVTMLPKLFDPSAIGSAMAVALLTTLSGALVVETVLGLQSGQVRGL